MKVIILHPKLDITQKLIDEYWDKFIRNLRVYHEYNNDEVIIIEKPVTYFNPEKINELDFDLIYVPNKNKNDFPITDNRVRYYAQTVFPNYFSVDKEGCDSDLSWIKLDGSNIFKDVEKYDDNVVNEWFENFKSKNDITNFPYKDYILFIAQKNCLEALKTTLDYAVKVNKFVVIVNANIDLQNLVDEYKNAACVKLDIDDLIKFSDCVISDNSNHGFKALLYEKPVICFNMTPYIKMAQMCYPFSSSMEGIFFRNQFPISKYKNWLYWYVNKLINSESFESYKNINTDR